MNKSKMWLIGGIVLMLAGGVWAGLRAPVWRIQVIDFIDQARAADDLPELQSALATGMALPRIYPIGQVRRAAKAGDQALSALATLQTGLIPEEGQPLSKQQFLSAMRAFEDLDDAVADAHRAIGGVPSVFLNVDQRVSRTKALQALSDARLITEQLTTLRRAMLEHFNDDARVLLLLQNRNETRPTGGFAGSMVVLDFADNRVTGRFADVYALDRRVPDSAKLPAPAFFFPLSEQISLRDANLARDFADAARAYRHFFAAINEKEPETVVAINLSLVEEVLRRTGPVAVPEWDVTVTAENFDLVLSFLVESKAAGRYSTKEPVLAVANALWATIQTNEMDPRAWADFDATGYLAQGHVLAQSQLPRTKALIDAWGLSGNLSFDAAADDGFALDVVSIGANKSDRFIWTKVGHNTEINPNGTATHTVDLRRTHALRGGEMDALLGTETWPENLRRLLDTPTSWKLGFGENRAVVRAYVPSDAQFVSGTSPTGTITEGLSPDGRMRVFVVPMNVKPGESVVARLQYTTQLPRGSSDWRPYALHMVGTPGIARAQITKTISTSVPVDELVTTENTGLPQPLIEQYFRAVVPFSTE